MQARRGLFRRRWYYVVGTVLALGIIATLLIAAFKLTASRRIGSTASQAPSPGVAKIVSQDRLALGGTITVAKLPTASRSANPYFSGGSISPTALQADKHAVIEPDAPQVNKSNGLLSVMNVDGHAPRLMQSFDGINSFQDLLITGYYNDPPDQGLCVSPSFIVEEVNFAISIYYRDGSKAFAPISLNDFFSENPNEYTFDPRCYFDPASATWLSTMSAIDPNGRQSHLDLAVSSGIDPTAGWNVYRIDTTDTRRQGCPCFADNPRLGIDSFGVYVTQNEFNITNGPATFYGSQIYAISKEQLVALSSSPYFVHYSGLTIGGMDADALQPALNSSNESAEFFLSSLYRGLNSSNHLGVWALRHQERLNSDGIPTLSSTLIQSEVYGHPPLAAQKASSAPINVDDDRMDDVTYHNGVLWGSLYTVIKIAGDTVNRSGLAWFAVRPQLGQGILTSAHIEDQGYIAVKGEDLLGGAITVSPSGEGAAIMTLAGPDYFPSAVYTTFTADDKQRNFSPLQLAASGLKSAALGSCLPRYGGVCSWGDYSATAIDGLNGGIWLATEYVSGPTTPYENWGTRILEIAPTG